MKPITIDLYSRSACKIRNAGGKAAILARLHRKGFTVPPGFVITPVLFERLLHAIRWNPAAARDASIPGCCISTRLRQAMTSAEIPRDAADALQSAFLELGGSAAVRSSLIDEDGTHASFAGQLDTVLRVETEKDLIAAVKRCYASILNERFESYLRERFGLRLEEWIEDGAMAVLVQRMVEATVGGVMFSADPVCGRPNTVIEAVRGGCETAAGGTASPDRYVIDHGGAIRESSASVGAFPLLNDGQLGELARISHDLQDEMGAPQDIEWAWDGTMFYILQCRPITSLSGKNIYSNRLVSDMTPGLIKPLLWSTNVVDMTHNVFGRLFSGLLGRSDIDHESIIALIHSRVYVNATFTASLFDRLGLPCNFFEMMTRNERALHPPPKPDPRRLFTWIRMAFFAARHVNYRRPVKAFIDRHETRLDDFRQADWTGAGEGELLERINRLRRYHGETQWFMWISAMNMVVRTKILCALVSRDVPEIDPNNLLLGLRGLKSIEPNEKMRSMARSASGIRPDLTDLLSNSSDHEIRERLAATDEGRLLVRQFDGFMERYGFLSVNGTDFTISPWKENPDLIWNAVALLINRADDGRGAEAGVIRERAVKQVRDSLPQVKRLLFDRLYRSTVKYVLLRERITFFMSENAYQMRRIYLALSDSLVSRGALEAKNDIFFLTMEELEGMITSGRPDPSIVERVTGRKETLERDTLIEPGDTICCETPESCAPLAATRDEAPETCGTPEYLEGIRGSPGIARGRARIVRDPADVRRALSKDDILVVPFTDVGWTPLFPRIGGIVAETGGQLSHSAIIAREYGLPAVVDIQRATHIIRDGQPITVDGNRGRVYLHNDPQA
jgi:phosphohistidine swiveling domain-containing protein